MNKEKCMEYIYCMVITILLLGICFTLPYNMTVSETLFAILMLWCCFFPTNHITDF